MTLFLDVADEGQRATALLRGAKVDIFGLQARQIARLLVRHPNVQDYLQGKTMNLLQLIEMAPDAVAGAIAYGTGYDDDRDAAQFEQAKQKAASLVAGEQYDLLMAIFDVSFGERLNPFVKAALGRVKQQFAEAEEAPPTAAAEVPGEIIAPNKVRLTKSLKELKSSLLSGTRPEMFGATHQGNSQVTPS